MLVRLAIDFENPAEIWWARGGRELWESIAEGFDGSQVVLEESLARSWLKEAARLPGWGDGPDYAPHPVRLRPIPVDEEV
ncbi:MAG: hypothetical protein ACE5FG_14335 [Myxococcota bacterium]